MIHAWLAAAVGAVMSFGGASSTGDHHPPFHPGEGQASSTLEMRFDKGRHASSTPPVINVACVSAAVATREATLDTAVVTLTGSMNSAYTSRASALASAYAQTGNDAIRNAVKTAWQTFAAAMKLARHTWTTSREGAWAAFRTALKACGPGSTQGSDAMNASMEVQGL